MEREAQRDSQESQLASVSSRSTFSSYRWLSGSLAVEGRAGSARNGGPQGAVRGEAADECRSEPLAAAAAAHRQRTPPAAPPCHLKSPSPSAASSASSAAWRSRMAPARYSSPRPAARRGSTTETGTSILMGAAGLDRGWAKLLGIHGNEPLRNLAGRTKGVGGVSTRELRRASGRARAGGGRRRRAAAGRQLRLSAGQPALEIWLCLTCRERLTAPQQPLAGLCTLKRSEGPPTGCTSSALTLQASTQCPRRARARNSVLHGRLMQARLRADKRGALAPSSLLLLARTCQETWGSSSMQALASSSVRPSAAFRPAAKPQQRQVGTANAAGRGGSGRSARPAPLGRPRAPSSPRTGSSTPSCMAGRAAPAARRWLPPDGGCRRPASPPCRATPVPIPRCCLRSCSAPAPGGGHGQEGAAPRVAHRGQGDLQRRGGADHQRHAGLVHRCAASRCHARCSCAATRLALALPLACSCAANCLQSHCRVCLRHVGAKQPGCMVGAAHGRARGSRARQRCGMQVMACGTASVAACCRAAGQRVGQQRSCSAAGLQGEQAAAGSSKQSCTRLAQGHTVFHAPQPQPHARPALC